MVTLKDIGERVQRSVTTVSRALAGCSDVSPDTILLVRKTAEEMGYVPNTLAQRLQKKAADTIGIIMPYSSTGYAEPFFSELLAGIGKEASEQGLDLLVAYAKKENELSLYKKLVSGRRVDGFVISRTLCQDARIDYLASINFPFAAFGMVENRQDYPFVEEDGEYAMASIVNHLVEKGHKRIACICPPLSVMFSAVRLRGVRKRMEELDLPLSDEMVRIGSFDQKDGYEQAHRLLDLPNPPTAIIGFNDSIAFGVINAGKERGLVIGKDLAVTGFDDIPMAEMYRPPLTTVHQPIFEIGSLVTKLLVQSIQEKNPKYDSTSKGLEKMQVILCPKLIIRESS
ncbi:MAG: LacI family DNA-binding transcriptional regulator [Sphaerochaeta sp.]|nr:LacI family DNA-binding transcriptional regulator [Sphaerochaeta sp.]